MRSQRRWRRRRRARIQFVTDARLFDRHAARECNRQQEHDAVENGSEPDGVFEPELRQQHERREQRAGDSSGGVHGIEDAYAPSDLRFLGDGIARQYGKRRAHQRRRQCQRDEGAEQIEESGARMVAIGRRRLTAKHRLQGEIGCDQQQRNHDDGTAGDAQLEQRVGEHRPRDARKESFREQRAERESAHIGGQHRCDRELGSAEHDRELPGPGRLIYQRRNAAHHEAGTQQRESSDGNLRLDAIDSFGGSRHGREVYGSRSSHGSLSRQRHHHANHRLRSARAVRRHHERRDARTRSAPALRRHGARGQCLSAGRSRVLAGAGITLLSRRHFARRGGGSRCRYAACTARGLVRRTGAARA